jgi:branched-chain amino acid aminotransferase/4-amino-4-deoxychorismate lyase
VTGVPFDDRGFTLGDGLFETVLADAGRLVFWREHLGRLARGCASLGLPAPDAGACEAAAREALEAAGLAGTRAAVRLAWTAGSGGRGLDRPQPPAPRLVVTAAAAPRPSGSASLATASVRRNEGSPASRLKTLSYLDNVLARREARAAGADEALLLNNRGEVACAGAANLFWLGGGVLATPALDCGVLEGVVRAALIERARAAGVEVREVHAPRAELDQAEAIFVTNSLIGVRPVGRLDGRPLPQAEAGPLAEVAAGLA